MSLQQYLDDHFVGKGELAELAGISVDRIDQLLSDGAIPAATYISDGSTIESSAFGKIQEQESRPGEYFRRDCVRWVRLAGEAPEGEARERVLDTLSAEFGEALTELGLSHDQVQLKIAEFIPSFLDGTFGLCVADPSTGKGISRKEIFQEKLTHLTKNGSIANPDEMSRDELLELIDAYAKAAMPFSPAERPLSSRRRLVDDLRPVVERT